METSSGKQVSSGLIFQEAFGGAVKIGTHVRRRGVQSEALVAPNCCRALRCSISAGIDPKPTDESGAVDVKL